MGQLRSAAPGGERMLKKAILLLMLGGWAGIASAQGLPLPWVNADIGPVGAGGSATHNAGVFTVTGSGTDIWATRTSSTSHTSSCRTTATSKRA